MRLTNNRKINGEKRADKSPALNEKNVMLAKSANYPAADSLR
jgi:hypothetical protein